jgi:hypothetical protein
MNPGLNDFLDFSPRGYMLHSKIEPIAQSIADTGFLPEGSSSVHRDFQPGDLFDFEVLTIAIFHSIRERALQTEILIPGITRLLEKFRNLANLSIISSSRYKENVQVGEQIAETMDQIISYRKAERHHPILEELDPLLAPDDNFTFQANVLEEYLVNKWHSGLLVVGNLPQKDDRTLSFSAVLPEMVLSA